MFDFAHDGRSGCGPDEWLGVFIVFTDVVIDALISSGTLRKVPRRMRLRVISANQRSIRLSQEELVGGEAARRRGTHFGRPRKLNPEQAKLAQRLIDEGQSIREIADTFNVHTATIYRISKTAA